MNREKAWDFKLALTVVWMIFTVALAVWLLIFHARLFRSIEALATPEALLIWKHNKMVAYELITIIIALLLGGIGLFYFIFQERKRSEQIRQFFAVFSHELKTSLSRLRLQAEGLQEDLKKSGRAGPTLRLLEDMGKLEVQLENSLWVARADEDKFLIETLALSRTLSELAPQFPVQVHLSSEAYLRVDRRALESLIKNLFQNAIVHGQAENVWIDVETQGAMIKLTIRDDGKGYQGHLDQLGELFRRHHKTSGTGLGLFLVKKLTKHLGGRAEFLALTQGFAVRLELPGSLQSPHKSTVEFNK
ncbi:MAG: sensor histidine kinase [Bdellovibrio sp.]